MKKFLLTILVVILVCSTLLVTACSHTGDTIIPNNPSTSDGNNPDDNTSDNTGDNPGGGNQAVAKYNIYYYTGDKATQVPTQSGIEEGTSITPPNNPQMIGYDFGGWFTDYGTFEIPFNFDKMPARNIVLYAKWIKGTSDEQFADYEATLAETSESGHLYIHYIRFDNEPEKYAKMSLWVWPKAYTGRTFNWNCDDNGTVIVDDIGGAVCDIDLSLFYDKAGNDEKETLQFFKDGYYGENYKEEYIHDESKYLDKDLGFLIVYDESKDSGTHWTSDGGNQYFTISNVLRADGSIHIFATQDNVGDFVHNLSDKTEVSNPYEDDDGSKVSISNVDSSVSLGKTPDPDNLFDTVSGVGYQIMVASFADSDGDGYGDIRGIIENLDYLEKLNVDTLWLTPIQYSDSYHGYDIIDYCAVDPKFGSLDDYKELLTKCHEKGMKVIMDLVLNHTSVNNKWFQNSAKMKVEDGIDYRSFYHWRNHTTEDLSESWYQYSEYDYSYYAKFASGMPELNYDYQPTRDAILNVAKFWMTLLDDNSGVDGFRIDAVKHIYMADEVDAKSTDIIIEDYDQATNTDYSSNLTKNLNFFSWLISGVKAINPNVYMVGENFDGHAFNVAPYYESFDGMLDFYMYYNIGQVAGHAGYAAGLAGKATSSDGSVPKGQNTNNLYGGAWSYLGVLETEKKYGGEVSGSLFTSNHDLPRLINNVAGSFVNKDWIAGTITATNSKEMQQRAITAITAYMTLPGVSWIYYGDELGMSSNYGTGEGKNSPHVDRQYRQPFKWTTNKSDSEYTTAYSISGDKTYYVEWDSYNKTLPGVAEQLKDSNSFLNEVMKWTKLKSTDNVIRYGDYKLREFGENGDMFAFTRSYNGTTYWVVCNFGTSEYRNAKSVFGANSSLVCATNGASLDYIPVGGTVVAKIS